MAVGPPPPPPSKMVSPSDGMADFCIAEADKLDAEADILKQTAMTWRNYAKALRKEEA